MKILLVEDDAIDAESVTRMLSRPEPMGPDEATFSVVRVDRLGAALEKLESAETYDLVLLDLGLPDSQGIDSVGRIREKFSDLPVVVLSGQESEALAVDAVRHGAEDYLVKGDVHRKVLVRVMRYAIERKRAHEELVAATRELEQRTADLAATNRELARKNEEMEQFVYTVSHDLKSPLVTMRGFVGVLKEDLAPERDEAIADSIGRIEKAAGHMTRLIEDLLKLSRAGRTSGRMEPIDVSRLLRELTVDLQPNLEALGTTIEIQDDMPEITADRAAIGRVFENLLNNAIKYGCQDTGSKITVGAERLDGEVRFFVRDNGPGIAPEYHDKIFSLFQRLDSGQDGTGIGLAIVQKIMHVHKGRAWVESAPGEGATFWLAFEEERDAVAGRVASLAR